MAEGEASRDQLNANIRYLDWARMDVAHESDSGNSGLRHPLGRTRLGYLVEGWKEDSGEAFQSRDIPGLLAREGESCTAVAEEGKAESSVIGLIGLSQPRCTNPRVDLASLPSWPSFLALPMIHHGKAGGRVTVQAFIIFWVLLYLSCYHFPVDFASL